MNRTKIVTITMNTINLLFMKSFLALLCISSLLWIETHFVDDDSIKKPCDTRPQQNEIKQDKKIKGDCFF